MPPGRTPQVSHIVIRRTHLYRIAAVDDVTISRMDEDADEVFLFASLDAPLSVHVGDVTALVPPQRMVVVHEKQMGLRSHPGTGVVLAVSPAAVIRGMNLPIFARAGGITQVQTNSLLGKSLELALMRAFDAADANGGYLDPRVIDVLHLMSRSIIQLPADVETPHPGTVTPVERARALIAETHIDAATTPESIADVLGIPLRTLQRAFSAEGSCIARELRRARASTAAAILASPSAYRRSAIRSARDAGFGSVASMRRALREFEMDDDADGPPR